MCIVEGVDEGGENRDGLRGVEEKETCLHLWVKT